MPKINILSPLVADMIAAGEVVERPASAVKELLENAVDAGAKNITVEIRSGGAEYIRVTDDGCGMSPEDAGIAFLRHATSKLRDEKGLEAIGTLGFRGEALAAIGSVSHVELMTRERGTAAGTRLLLDGGEISEMSERGCPEGTTILVRGLFYNTPARLKFMKSDRAEGAACTAAALRCALGRPDASVRCIRDGKEEFFTPGDGRAASCVYALLGRETAGAMLAASSDDGAAAVSGFVSSPAAARGSRSGQFFFCNGRYIRSQLLQAAVEQAYRHTLMTGRFPACVLYVTLAPGAVDVNVHPAKTEVKFSSEKRVFDAVYYAALGALEAPRPPAEAPAAVSAPRVVPRAPEPVRAPAPGAVRQPGAVYQTRLDMTPAPLSAPPPQEAPPVPRPPFSAPREAAPLPAFSAPAGAVRASEPQPEPAEPADREPVRVIGEALDLYILVQQGEKLIIIDKHAAHERLLFDRLRREGAETPAQTLLEPVPVNAGAEGAAVISENGALLSALGFELDPCGDTACLLRAVPAGIDPGDAGAALDEVLDALRKNQRVDPARRRDEALKTVACKAAIKAGYKTDPRELQTLAEAVCAGEVRLCPHGRPVAWTLTRQELDRQFKRII